MTLFTPQREDSDKIGELQYFPPNGTFNLMYYPYYGKKAQVKQCLYSRPSCSKSLVAVVKSTPACSLSASTGELLSAVGCCQVPEHNYQWGRQHRVQNQLQQHSHWTRKGQVCWKSVLQAEDQHQQLGWPLPSAQKNKTPNQIKTKHHTTIAPTPKPISGFTPFARTCLQPLDFSGESCVERREQKGANPVIASACGPWEFVSVY